MDDGFNLSLFPGSHTVCGQRLPAFSLWHVLTLDALGSPLALWADTDQKVQPNDLLIALAVCLSSFPNQPDLRPRRWARRWARKMRTTAAFRAQLEAFLAYRSAHSSLPRFTSSEAGPGSRQITAPALLHRAAGLFSASGLTAAAESHVYNMSLGRMWWTERAIAEREGQIMRFLYDDDLEWSAPEQPQTEDEVLKMAIESFGEKAGREWYAGKREKAIQAGKIKPAGDETR